MKEFGKVMMEQYEDLLHKRDIDHIAYLRNMNFPQEKIDSFIAVRIFEKYHEEVKDYDSINMVKDMDDGDYRCS